MSRILCLVSMAVSFFVLCALSACSTAPAPRPTLPPMEQEQLSRVAEPPRTDSRDLDRRALDLAPVPDQPRGTPTPVRADVPPVPPDPMAPGGVPTQAVPPLDEPPAVTAPAATAPLPPAPRTVTVQILPRGAKSKVGGTVTLVELTGGGTLLMVEVTGASPGLHGVHVHEKADCSAPDASSAGDHWNPGGHAHGLPSHDEHHAGDLGNIEIDRDGRGKLAAVIPDSSLATDGADRSLIGRALIVHRKKDDGKSQPSGKAGDRIGCAEIR